MPEGDAIHRAAAALRMLVGQRVEAESPHPRGVVTGVARAVDGRLLESVDAVGKNLLLRFEGGVTVRSHLRMSGRWRVQARGGKVFGRPWLVLRGERWEAIQSNGPVLEIDTGVRARVGPDVLGEGVESRDLVGALRGADPRCVLGEALLDQRAISGVGNMWAAVASHRIGTKLYPTGPSFGVTLKLWGGGWWPPGGIVRKGHVLLGMEEAGARARIRTGGRSRAEPSACPAELRARRVRLSPP